MAFDFAKLTRKAQRAAFAHMSTSGKASKAKSAAKVPKPKTPGSAHKKMAAADKAQNTGNGPVGTSNLAPPKPKRMSEKRYRELHDSSPMYVEIPGARFKVAGPVSAQVLINSYRKKGIEPTVRPASGGQAGAMFNKANAVTSRRK